MHAVQNPMGQFEFSVLSTKGYRPKRLSDALTVFKWGMHMV